MSRYFYVNVHCNGADIEESGMMMYAHLVFQVAAHLGTPKDIQTEFQNLPQNLDAAYEFFSS
jgi:hypothetical protein